MSSKPSGGSDRKVWGRPTLSPDEECIELVGVFRLHFVRQHDFFWNFLHHRKATSTNHCLHPTGTAAPQTWCPIDASIYFDEAAPNLSGDLGTCINRRKKLAAAAAATSPMPQAIYY